MIFRRSVSRLKSLNFCLFPLAVFFLFPSAAQLGKLSGCAVQGAKTQTAELLRIRNQTQETCNRSAVKGKCVPQW